MDISALQHAASGNDWCALWPELALGCLALLLIVLDLVFPQRSEKLIPGVALVGQLALLAVLGWTIRSFVPGETFNGLLRLSRTGQAMRCFFLLSSIFVCLLRRIGVGRGVLAEPRLTGTVRPTSDRNPLAASATPGMARMPGMEFYHIVLVVTAALMLLAQSNHFILLFVTLETVSIGLYILVSYDRASALTLEAG